MFRKGSILVRDRDDGREGDPTGGEGDKDGNQQEEHAAPASTSTAFKQFVPQLSFGGEREV